MVRMDKPSPIQVGREFVRQYYTLLNKAPELLHRFYGAHSSYIHGGGYCNGEPEEGVIGQTEIHKKITSLSFKDCHTKVRQVDAHSSISGGVVVQVIGELSNDRNPLRKFMQTFVLAPQGDNPYKFYVHNDIFRYADEVFMDEQSVDHIEEQEEQANVPTNDDLSPDMDRVYYQQQQPEQRSTNPIDTNGITEPEVPMPASQEARLITTPSPTPVTPVESPVQLDDKEDAQEEEVEVDEKTEPVEELQPKENKEATPTASEQIPEKADAAPQKFSWAALASKNTPAQANAQQGTVVKAAQSEDVETRDRPQPRPQRPRGNPQNVRQQQDRGPPRDEDRNQGMDRGIGGGPNMRRAIRYADNQQIFVGNLPVDIVEAELREHFQSFGEILEVRINHSHSNNPSFGFVIFEDPKSTDEVLRQMPTTFKNNKRINIEEKKQRIQNRDRDMRRGTGDNRRDNIRGPRDRPHRR